MRRRDLLKLGGLALGGAALAQTLAPEPARAQQPKRGGPVTIPAWDPPHFDPHHAHILYPQTPGAPQGRARDRAGDVPDRGRLGRVVEAAWVER